MLRPPRTLPSFPYPTFSLPHPPPGGPPPRVPGGRSWGEQGPGAGPGPPAALGGRLPAQEEPPLFETPAAPEQPAPSPTPAAALPSVPPASPLGPLPPRLDFARWQVMTARERQTYVEGALSATDVLTARLREEVVNS